MLLFVVCGDVIILGEVCVFKFDEDVLLDLYGYWSLV